MKKKVASIIILMCMIINMLPALAEELANVDVIDTSSFTADNVIYETLQNTDGVSLFSDTPRSVNSDFDVVLGFDMSVDMYGFDYNGEMAWLDAFRALSEQVPDGTRFAVVTDSAANLGEDLESGISRVTNVGYQGSSNIASLLDNCLDTFGEDSSDKNKVVIAVTANVDDTYALQNSIENLLSHGIIPFIFVLNSEDNNLDGIDYVYHCTNDLELRLDMSDVFLSFAEFNTAQTTSLRSALQTTMTNNYDMTSSQISSSAIVGSGNIYNSDFRTGKHNYPFAATNEADSFGMAISSILNIYRCLPLQAESESINKSYDLFAGNVSSDLFSMLETISTGYIHDISQNASINTMIDFWGSLRSELGNELISITRNDTGSEEYIIGSEAQTRITDNLKRRFPVLLKIYQNSYIVTKYERNGSSVTLSVLDYTRPSSSQETTLVFNVSGNNWVLSDSSQSNVVDDNTEHEYNTMVFDMYSYIKSYASAYNITDTKSLEDNQLKVTFNLGATPKSIVGVVKDKNNVVSTAIFDGNTTSQSDNNVLITSAVVKYTAGQPDIYNASKIHRIKVYTDVSKGQWYYQYVMRATERGIMNGYDENSVITFRPEGISGESQNYGHITRGEFVKTALAAAGFDNIEVYTDVDGVWAKNYLEEANELGILSNYVEFSPTNVDAFAAYQDELLKRYEAADILYQLLIKNVDNISVPTMLYEYAEDANILRNAEWKSRPFEDQDDIESKPSEVVEAARQMYLNNIMVGVVQDNGTYLYPDNLITRAEVSKMITKCLFNLDEDIETIQVTYENVDGMTEQIIDFSDSPTGETVVTGVVDSSGSKEYLFVAPKTGYYYIYNINNCTVSVSDMHKREIRGLDVTDDNNLIIGTKYNIKQGETAYVTVNTNNGSGYSFNIRTPQDSEIVFAPDRSGTYIYDNNHESIRRENVVNLSDDELPNRSWLMTNKNLGVGKYVIFSSHNNETCYDYYSDPTDESLWYRGFDIYIDALITSHNGAQVTINNAGYWTGIDTNATAGISWSAIQAYSDYTGETIHEVGFPAGEVYGLDTIEKDPFDYEPHVRINKNVQLNFPQNRTCWLSEGIESMYGANYILPCPNGRPLFFVAEITVTGNEQSSIDINIGALKSDGSSSGISTCRTVVGNVAEGAFVPQPQIKGVSNALPVVETDLMYEIDDTSTLLPIVVSNHNNGYNPTIVNQYQNFVTHGAPKEDTYLSTMYNYVENDMLDFNYDGYNYNIYDGWLSDNGLITYMLANFGVKNVYNVSIKNNSANDKKFVYEMTTATNYMVKITSHTDGDNNTPTSSMFSRNEVEYYITPYEKDQVKAPIEICTATLKAGETTNIILEVWSPTNVTGSLENKFLIE